MGQKYSASPIYSHSLVPLSSKLSSQVELCKLNTEPNEHGRERGDAGYTYTSSSVGVPGSPLIFSQVVNVGSRCGRTLIILKHHRVKMLPLRLLQPTPKICGFLRRDEHEHLPPRENLIMDAICDESYAIWRFTYYSQGYRRDCIISQQCELVLRISQVSTLHKSTTLNVA